jgi:hypothetical protein
MEVIKASYRSLMSKLKAHPDLGGDHELAILINQAYAVLSDPKKRKQYDETILSNTNQRSADSLFNVNAYSSNGFFNERESNKAYAAKAQHSCLFCGTELKFLAQRMRHCSNCGSPLNQMLIPDRQRELIGRRRVPRVAKTGDLIIYPSWPHAGYTALLRDLSPSGISLLTEYNACPGQTLKVSSSSLNAVTRVISVHSNGKLLFIRGAFLTSEFTNKTGVFVAEKI